jgi:SAM-dependent MidA family methyltransferase
LRCITLNLKTTPLCRLGNIRKINGGGNILFAIEVTQGYITEVNERAIAWVESLSETMDKGLVLLIDYGIGREEYFHPQRGAGTLRCYYQHKASENPFVHIGKQDITTSVNFSDIAEAAERGGFEVQGYATQALFLISLGIDEYLLAEHSSLPMP